MDSFSKLLNSHRSIRAFKPDSIPASLVESVCADAIAGGSSSGNLNSVSLILTRSEERKKKLFEFHFKQPMILRAPLLITFCADWHRTREWLKRRGARDNFNNLLGYHVAAFDAMIVAQNVCLGFEAQGLGICYMGTTLHVMPELSEYFELPETVAPVTTIVVGYPDENPAKRDRLPLAAFLHEERYRPTSDDEIEATYQDRDVKGWQRYQSMPALKAMMEREGISSLAEFYTSKIKYDPDVFARDSAKLEAFLRKQGLL
jgi:nitroreductase